LAGKADIPILALVIAGLAIIPLSFLPSFSPSILVQTVILLSLVYAAYWALEIRSTLAIGLYRHQALGLALVALSFGALDFSFVVVPNSPASIPLFWLALLVTYYFMDESILAARRSDPFRRDSFHWRRLRIALWTLIAVAIAEPAAFFGLGPTPGPTPLTFQLLFLPVYPVVVAGTIVLPVSVLRTRDTALRRQIKWFGAFILLLLGPLPASSIVSPSLNLLFSIVGLLAGAYCLYRSARSLAPLNRVEVEMPGLTNLNTGAMLNSGSSLSIQ
jgi:hypothetical protein